jgi:trimethylamine:corrinoid methyltransferase-like protein
MFAGMDFRGDFLKQRITKELFALEQHIPSKVIDRDSTRGWQQSGSLDTWRRAKERARQLLEDYQPPQHDPEQVRELRAMVERLAQGAGMDHLPEPA